MLRLIYVSLSAFLLLSTVGIQNVQAQGAVGTAVRSVTRGAQVLQGLARIQRGAQGVARFNSLVGPQIMQIASQAGIVGVNLAQVIEQIEASGNATLQAQVAPLYSMLTLEVTRFERELQSIQSSGKNNIGSEDLFNEENFAFEEPSVADVIAAQPLENQVADQLATEKSNFRVVIDAVRDAFVTRAFNFGVPQMSGLGERLHTHLTRLVNSQHLNLLGSRAEECVRTWEASYNSAVSNMASILLAVAPDTSTYSFAKDQMLKAMHTLFGGALAELQGRLNVLTSDRCNIYSHQLAAAG